MNDGDQELFEAELRKLSPARPPAELMAKLEGQLLVVPAQFRKLVQVHKQSDAVELVFYRVGKKQTVSATLGKAPAGFSRLEDGHSWDGESEHFELPFGPNAVVMWTTTPR